LNKRAKKTSGKNKEKISSEKGENFRQSGEGVGEVVEVIHHQTRSKNFPFQLSPVQHEQVNNSHNPGVATYEKHWHFFSFVFSGGSQASMSCLIFFHLLQTYLTLTSILLDLPKFKKDCIVPSEL